jgi:hypothetical protein
VKPIAPWIWMRLARDAPRRIRAPRLHAAHERASARARGSRSSIAQPFPAARGRKLLLDVEIDRAGAGAPGSFRSALPNCTRVFMYSTLISERAAHDAGKSSRTRENRRRVIQRRERAHAAAR